MSERNELPAGLPPLEPGWVYCGDHVLHGEHVDVMDIARFNPIWVDNQNWDYSGWSGHKMGNTGHYAVRSGSEIARLNGIGDEPYQSDLVSNPDGWGDIRDIMGRPDIVERAEVYLRNICVQDGKIISGQYYIPISEPPSKPRWREVATDGWPETYEAWFAAWLGDKWLVYQAKTREVIEYEGATHWLPIERPEPPTTLTD